MSDRFTKEEAEKALECADVLFKAIPKSKRMGYLGELNDLCLFLEDAKRHLLLAQHEGSRKSNS